LIAKGNCDHDKLPPDRKWAHRPHREYFSFSPKDMTVPEEKGKKTENVFPALPTRHHMHLLKRKRHGEKTFALSGESV
jgi:hypothetical protein